MLADFAERTSVVVRGCATPGSGSSCLAQDAVGLLQIRAEIQSMVEEIPDGAVPAASTWGIAVLALALLVGAMLYFGRRHSAPDA